MKLLSFEDKECVDILKRGDVLAFPTETVFGLGVRYDSKKAFDKLVAVKRRSPDKPFTLMGASIDCLDDFAILGARAKKVIETFMPGPLTVLLRPQEGLYPHVSLKSDKIGFRVPGLEDLRKLISRVGVPLLVPSANKAGEKPALTSREVMEAFDGEISAVIEGTIHLGSLPSTIVDLSIEGKVVLIRQGELSLKTIMEVYNS